MDNQMIVYAAIVVTYLSVAIAAVVLLVRKPSDKKPVTRILANAKDFAASTIKHAAMQVTPSDNHHTKHGF